MTSTPRLLTALRDRLEALLPEKCRAAGLPAPTEYLDSMPGYLTPARAPQVWVACEDEGPGPVAGIGGTNAHQSRSRTVTVGVTLAGEDVGSVDHALYAMANLVLETLLQDQSAGGEGHGVEWVRTAYSPNLADTGLGLFREAALTFTITRWAVLGQD